MSETVVMVLGGGLLGALIGAVVAVAVIMIAEIGQKGDK